MRTAGSAEKEESWRRWRRVVCGVRSSGCSVPAIPFSFGGFLFPFVLSVFFSGSLQRRVSLLCPVISITLCFAGFLTDGSASSLGLFGSDAPTLGDESRSTWRLFGGRFRRIQFGGGRHLFCSSRGILGFRGLFRFW